MLINNQIDIGHPGVQFANLGAHVRKVIVAWADMPEDELPYRVGTGPGELFGSGEGAVGVYESDEGTCHEYAMTFNEWMLSYLRGENMTVWSRSSAPDRPFYEQRL